MPAGRWEMKKRRSGDPDVVVERGLPVTGVRGKRGIVAGQDRDGGSSRDRGNRTRERERQRSSGVDGVGVWSVSKFERRPAISRGRRREPCVIARFDLKRVAKRSDQRGA